MGTSRRIIVVVAMAIVIVSNLPCIAAENKQKDEKSIWLEEGPRGPGGPERWPRRFELSDEEIGRIMKSLKESDPERAKQIQKLRRKDPNRFQFELGRHGGEEFGRIVRRRTERWWHQKQAEFLQWLDENYPQDAKELVGLKEKDTKLYWDKFGIINRKYRRIYEEEKRNPELAEVLKEDLQLKKTRDGLIEKIRTTKIDEEKKNFARQLEEVVGRRFDLIIRRKRFEYERLLKWVEQLQKQLEESKAEIAEWSNEKTKEENVKNRVNELLRGHSFRWD